MRSAAAILWIARAAWAQFKSTVPLVVAPTTVTDSKGHFVDGLSPEDLVLYDNNVPQPIQVEEAFNPLSLIVAIQASANSSANLEKLGDSGILLSIELPGTPQEVIEAVDQKLLPAAQNADLKKMLTDAQGPVQKHLDRAREIQGKLK